KIKEKISPSLKAIISGGAPLCESTLYFFHAIGIYLIQGYGLTETTGILCANSFYFLKPSSVGKPLEGVQIKIAEDKEILTKGEINFNEYWNKPEATQESFTEDGWFKTGDLGELDENNFLSITGRKKDLIVTAGGKKIAPTLIEETVKQSPFIDHVAVFGDKQKWLTALITLNKELVLKYFKQEKMDNSDWTSFVKSKELIDFIEKEISNASKELPEFEKIKKFMILAEPFTNAKDELTHTMKVKRNTILKNYHSEIESMHK
ncbi:MAG: AMP-binding protein, partial [Candidatus Caenarcaniphilales bacterium]|nr:AMP-binding protein [Candidatus Caenarcaniphilales bacterium]